MQHNRDFVVVSSEKLLDRPEAMAWRYGFATIAIVWLIALLWKRIGKNRLNIGVIVSCISAIVIIWNAYVVVSNQIASIQNHDAVFLEYRDETRSEEELIQLAVKEGAWEYVANVNAVRGGPVWRGLASYYGVS